MLVQNNKGKHTLVTMVKPIREPNHVYTGKESNYIRHFFMDMLFLIDKNLKTKT